MGICQGCALGGQRERHKRVHDLALVGCCGRHQASPLICPPPMLCLLPHTSHLAARPPGLRLETLGFPSLSVPPEIVRPRVLPSRLISSTMVMPRNSSADRQEDEQGVPALGPRLGR